jgi:tetratricopeptide (TPR) repeat protein
VSDKVATLLDAADRLAADKRWSEAEAVYSDAHASAVAEPHLGRALLGRSGCRLMLKDLDGAIRDAFERARLLPQDGARHAWLGGLLVMAKHFEAAVRAYQLAFAHGVDDAANRGACGEAYQQLGDLRGALDELGRAVAIDPSFAPAWKSRGVAHACAGDFDAAIRDWERAMALDPAYRTLLDGFIAEADGLARRLDGIVPAEDHRVVRVAFFGSTEAGVDVVDRVLERAALALRLWGRRARNVSVVRVGELRGKAMLAEWIATDDRAELPDLVAGAHGVVFVSSADGALAAQLEAHRELMAAIDESPWRPPVVHLIWATDDELPRRRLRTALRVPEASIVTTAQDAFRAAIKAALLKGPPSRSERRGRGRPA